MRVRVGRINSDRGYYLLQKTTWNFGASPRKAHMLGRDRTSKDIVI